MDKTTFSSLVLASALLYASCSPHTPTVEEHQAFSTTAPLCLGIRNLTVIRIVPADKPLTINWNGFDTLTSNAMNVGFEELTVSDADQTFFITDKMSGNNQLSVNGKLYTFAGVNLLLEVSFKAGVRVASMADCGTVRHIYDPQPKG